MTFLPEMPTCSPREWECLRTKCPAFLPKSKFCTFYFFYNVCMQPTYLPKCKQH